MTTLGLGQGALRIDAAAQARGESIADDVEGALRLAPELSPIARGLHRGGCTTYLAALAGLGRADLTAARTLEPHLDAQAILAQAGITWAGLAPLGVDRTSTWGVFAAAAPNQHLTARETGAGSAAGWVLEGTKPWCSLAARLSHALVTASGPDGHGRLFALDLRHPGVHDLETPWVPRGLRQVRTTTLTMTQVPGIPVGPQGWYLSRPGFAWGAIGVAAVWYGAATALRTTLFEASRRRAPDQIASASLGRVDVALYAAGCVLEAAGRLVDEHAVEATQETHDGEPDWALLAARVRAAVHDAAETCLAVVGHALGPGPLTGDEVHARRVADLSLYLRQHHAERDLARLGGLILAAQDSPAQSGPTS